MKKNILTSKFNKIALHLALILGCCSVSNALFAQPSSTLNIGTGTSETSSVPVYTCYVYSYTQQIFTAADILAANGNEPTATNTITGIRFKVTSLPSSTSNSSSWTLFIGQTSQETFTSGTSWVPLSSLTEVFNGTVTYPAVNQWMEFIFDTPFEWDGTSNIVIAGKEDAPGYDCTVYFQSHSKSNGAIYYYSDSNDPDPANPPSGYTVASRNNIQLDFVVPPDNIGVDSIYVPQSVFCSGDQPVSARIHNYGSSVVSNYNVHWSVNGVEQPVIAMTGVTLDMENTSGGPNNTVTLGTIDFPYNADVTIEAWTSMPNGVADTKPDNDSASTTITATLQGFLTNISPQDTIFCTGGSLTLDAGEAPNSPIYIWNNGMLTQNIQITQGGTYYVKVQNMDGCIGRDTVFMSEIPQPVVNSIAIIDNGGGTFTFNVIGAQNEESMVWDFGDGTTATGPGPIEHTYEEEGFYTVVLTLTNECGSVTVTRLVAVGPTAVGELEALENALNLYPNPANAIVTLSNSGDAQIQQVAIYNLLGQRVYQQPIAAGVKEIQIPTSSFSNGIYHVQIETSVGTLTRKLEIVR